MNEVLNQIWGYVLPIGGGVTLGALIIAILVPTIKGVINKAVSKVDIAKIEQAAVDKGLDKIKTVSFKQSIQPVVESELRKISEEANRRIDSKIDEMNTNYTKLVNILAKLAAYFDNSIAVTDEAKKELYNAIADAQKDGKIEQTISVEEFIADTPPAAETPVFESENGDGYITVER